MFMAVALVDVENRLRISIYANGRQHPSREHACVAATASLAHTPQPPVSMHKASASTAETETGVRGTSSESASRCAGANCRSSRRRRTDVVGDAIVLSGVDRTSIV